MKKSFLVFMTIILGTLSFSVSASETQARGAQVLDMQLQRARHLKELEFQAEVLERQARIAKAQQQIDKTTGLEAVASFSPRVAEVVQAVQQLPSIVELTASSVTFKFPSGESGVYRIGDTLPSGHQLDSISMINGVVLSTGSQQYQVNFNW